MPRDGSGVYSPPAGTKGSPNTTIESSKYNAFVDDLASDANAARPITAGGTGETSARLKDGTWRFQNTSDTTKLLAFDLSGITAGTTRTLTVPNDSGELALLKNDLAALEALGSTGIAVRTTGNTWAQRGIAGTPNQIAVTNGNGVSGDPTIALTPTIDLSSNKLQNGAYINPTLMNSSDNTKLAAFDLSGISTGTTRILAIPNDSGELALLKNDLAALEALGSTGIAVRTTGNTWAQRGIVGTANQITVTNGDGVSGNPTVSLPSSLVLPGTVTVTGGQVGFPATQAPSSDANTLDDYEEGSTNPTPIYQSGASTNVSVTLHYTKVGRAVMFVIRVTMVTISTASGAISLALPFTAGAMGGGGGGVKSVLGGTAVSVEIGANSSTATLRLYDAATALQDGATLQVAGVYFV